MNQPKKIMPAEGKLGILLPGMGAVGTTTIAGTMLARKGLAPPIGSMTQLGHIRLGKRTENRHPKVKDFIPLASLDNIVFGGWDIFADNVYEAASHAEVLKREHLDVIKDELSAITPMKGVFYPEYVKRLHGTHLKSAPTKADMVMALREDIRSFMKTNRCDRAVAVWFN